MDLGGAHSKRRQYVDGKRLKAAAVGLLATGVDVAVVAMLLASTGRPAVAGFVGAACGAAVGYWVARQRVFGPGQRGVRRQLPRYAAVAGTTACLMSVAMSVAMALAVPWLLAKTLASAAVFAMWSYPAQRRWVFV